MRINVGTFDRIFRAVLGLALLYLAFLSGLPLFGGALLKYGAAVVGIVMLVVATTRVCPVYAVLGIKTCPA
ncbi:MAG: YgaP family membrane protein [Pseudomonadota bacterium]